MKPVVIAAGGTGGHFFPAEALAAALMARGERVVLMTDARYGGLASPVFANAERYVIAGAGLSGRNFLRAVKGGFLLLQGVAQARAVLKDLQPEAVVAFGGYPAVAPVLAAFSLRHRPKILLHEQNAVLGRANRLLARMADFLLLSFEKTKAAPKTIKIIMIGNPVRAAIAALDKQTYVPPAAQINILVLGGSLGAKIFGTLIPQALALLSPVLRGRLQVTQQCRMEEHETAAKVFADAGINAELSPFFSDVAEKLRVAHLVIARAGASTIAELAVAGKPAIFIPLPGAIDDHQRANADALANAGGGWRVDQAELTPENLAARIETLLNEPAALTKAAFAASKFGRPDAAEKLADMVQGLMVGAEL